MADCIVQYSPTLSPTGGALGALNGHQAGQRRAQGEHRMTTFSSRVGRLERHRAPNPGDPFGLDNASDEQLLIGLLDICRLELEDLELTTVRRSEIETKISEIEDRIRKTANMWAD